MLRPFRRLLRLLHAAALALPLLLPFALPAMAQVEEEADADIARFVAANTLWTFFHELGHGFVSLYDLPVVGREEDAVDQLATLVMLNLYGTDEQARELVTDAAYGWLLAVAQADELNDSAFWGQHSLGIQRFNGMVCLLAGANATDFAELVEMAEMPADAVERCADDYATVARNWDKLLKPHRGSGGKGRLIARFQPSRRPAATTYVAALKESGFTELLADIAKAYRLPRDVSVIFKDCGEDNAFWDAGRREISMCYEMMDGLAALASE